MFLDRLFCVLFFIALLCFPVSASLWNFFPIQRVSYYPADLNGGSLWLSFLHADSVDINFATVHDFITINDTNITGDLNVSGDLNVVGDANFVNIGVSNGAYFNRLNATGDSNFGNIGASGDMLLFANNGTLIWNSHISSLSFGKIFSGTRPTATGAGSFAMGYGNSLASGDGSFATGYGGHATADYATSFGFSNIASGYDSFATGYLTKAEGWEAFTMGAYTIASGKESFAGGSYSRAIGDNSIAFGLSNLAIGDDSVSLGYNNISAGEATVTLGKGITCEGAGQTCVGDFNAAGDANVLQNLGVDGNLYVLENLFVKGDTNHTGSVQATGFYGDGSGLTGISAGVGWVDLNAHLVPYVGATKTVNLGSQKIRTTGDANFGNVKTADLFLTDVYLGSAYERLVYPTFSISGSEGDNPRTVTVQFKDYGGTNVAKYIHYTFWISATAYSTTAASVGVADGGNGSLGTATTIERFAITNSSASSQVALNSGSEQTLYFMVVNPTDGKVYYTSGVWGVVPP